MKKILLMMYYMHFGGVEQAIIELIKNIDPLKYQIDLLLLEKKGEFLKNIPDYVNLIEIPIDKLEKHLVESRSIRDTIKFGVRNKMYLKTFIIALKFLYFKLNKTIDADYETVFCNKKNLNYDIAMDFHGYLSLTTYYIAKKVDSDKKYTWIHSESFVKDLKVYTNYLKEYNKIFCVSEKCAEITSQVLKDFKNVEVFRNFIDSEMIKKKASSGERIRKENGRLELLTVGRIAYEKGFDIAVETAKLLKERNLNFKWFFCGDGDFMEDIRNKITVYKLNDEIELLGFKENPYGYMDSCDIYVQTSRFEGYGLTIGEANILNKVIVTTDVCGARENVVDGINGLVTNIDPHSIADAIQSIVSDNTLINNVSFNKSRKPVNTESMLKLKEILTLDVI